MWCAGTCHAGPFQISDSIAKRSNSAGRIAGTLADVTQVNGRWWPFIGESSHNKCEGRKVKLAGDFIQFNE